MTEADYTPQQKANMQAWVDLQNTLNRGEFDERMDSFFHPDFRYSNPARPDLGTYAQWKVSPEELWKRFTGTVYSSKDMVARGDDVWAYCKHTGTLTGGPYMGVQPKGQKLDCEWFSIITFKDGKIIHIFSIADMLDFFIQVGVLPETTRPVNPYR